MPNLEDIIARAHADRQRAVRDAVRGRDLMERSDAEMKRLDGFLATLTGYGVDVGRDMNDAFASAIVASNRRDAGKAALAVDISDRWLRGNAPASIDDLVAAVKADGLEIGGDERARLAGYLSKSDRVYHQRGVGWFSSSPQTNNGSEANREEGSDPLSVSSNEGGADGTALA